MINDNLRVLIVAEHASLKFGGEAALPLHYFRFLRKRGVEAWLLVHERTRDELNSLFFMDFDRIYFVPDTSWHLFLFQLGNFFPARFSYFTFWLLMRLITQTNQRRVAKKLISEKKINVIHQPIPVSPSEPSMIFGLGVPVIIGPMNGGMNYPPAFQKRRSKLIIWLIWSLGIGRFSASILNILIPGKRQAAALLVANSRSRNALPESVRNTQIVELVENGVDLSVWQKHRNGLAFDKAGDENQYYRENLLATTKFVYIGRLVDWKAVDLLLFALKQVLEQVPVELEIIGDGPERAALEAQSMELGLLKRDEGNSTNSSAVHFCGWLAQVDCAKRLQLAKALILPSLCECGGAVVLEAMAMSIPVIAINWGGPADYLDQSCGILVEPTSRNSLIQNLATAMLKIAQNPELSQEMGRAGYQRVLDYFDWEKKVDVITKIYRESLERQVD